MTHEQHGAKIHWNQWLLAAILAAALCALSGSPAAAQSCETAYHCYDDGKLFRSIAHYMAGEMQHNATAGLADRPFGSPPDQVRLGIWWMDKVDNGHVWDHKPKLQQRFGKVYADIPGQRAELFYDAWSNIHFGYVGAMAGITPAILERGADVNDLVNSGQTFEADRRWITLGIDMAQRIAPQQLTAELLEREMLAVIRGLGDVPCAERGVRDIGFGYPQNPLKMTSKPYLMLVGDSITHGKTGDFTWRYRLHEHLRRANVDFNFVGPFRAPLDPNVPDNVRAPGTYAVSGWDDDHDATWGWFLAFEAGVIEDHVRNYAPNVVVVHLGTNDLTWGWNEASGLDGNTQRVAQNMRDLIYNARRADPLVNFILVKIGATGPLASHAEPGPYNRMIDQIAYEMRTDQSCINVADVESQWDWHVDTYDETHPNINGEHIIAKAVADTLWDRWGWGAPYGPVTRVPAAPKRPTGVRVTPDTIDRTGKFKVTWERVVNPGVWTEYWVEVHTHHNFGFLPVWRSAKSTPLLELEYDGPTLPQTGVFDVVVVAEDIYGSKSTSDPVPLTVGDLPPPPPKPTNIRLEPALIGRDGGFIATWDRVRNPGVWTEYKVRVHTHHNFGFQQVWEQSGTTPLLSWMYDGPRFPIAGVYDVVVVARDQYEQETVSDPVPITVDEYLPPPLPPKNVRVTPNSVWRNGNFSVAWDRVPNPKVWTTYKIEVHYHRNYGFGTVWETPEATPDLSAPYAGPMLPQAGTFQVVVVAIDSLGQSSRSEPVDLYVTGDPPPPPPPTGIKLPPRVRVDDPFVISWDRVQQPGVWTTYRARLHYHVNYGFALLWEMPSFTTTTWTIYPGPALPQAGTYSVVIEAEDSFGQRTDSAPVDLVVVPAGTPL